MEGQIKSYKELIVWQTSIDMVVEVYRVTENFPRQEMFGLTSQMRRSAVSIPSNIAEGRGRGTRKDFSNFLKVSLGSSNELETQIEIAKRLNYLKKCDYLENLLVEIMKITNTMVVKLDYK